MARIANRIKVYSLYLLEYIKHGEISAVGNAFAYMLTGKSFAKSKVMTSSMGKFETRPRSLDFQYVNYAYEIDIKHFMEKEDFDVYFDIGACLGEYSIWLGKKGKRCFAFEPVQESFQMIQKNISLNHLENKVQAFNYGLGSRHSIEFFEMNETNPGANKRVEAEGPLTRRFEINSLDEKYTSFGLLPDDRILIKIDVEGMETAMLDGAVEFLRTFNNMVLIIEEKLSGDDNIRRKLNEIADFSYSSIDEFNICARKIKK